MTNDDGNGRNPIDTFIDRLERVRPVRLFWGVIAFSIVVTEAITSAMSLAFHGRVTVDYLVTGAVAATLVSVMVVALLLRLIGHLRDADRALRRSEADLLAAQRIAGIGSWVLDHRSNRLWWSEEIHRIFEFDPGRFDVSYEAFLGVVHPDDRERVHRTYTRSVSDGAPYEVEHRLLMKDGRIKFVEERGETAYDPSGNPLRTTGTVLDITGRRQTEAQLARALARQSLDRGLLALAMGERTTAEVLTDALRRLMDSSLVAILDQGAIFLWDPEAGELRMVAQERLDPRVRTECCRVPPGRCLCGRVALSGKPQYSNHLDEAHEVRFEGMADHGHYCIPICSGERLLGVLALYVPAGHRASEEELELLVQVGDTLGIVLEPKAMEGRLRAALDQANAAREQAEAAIRAKWIRPSAPDQPPVQAPAQPEARQEPPPSPPGTEALPELPGIEPEAALKRLRGNRALYLKLLHHFRGHNRDLAERIMQAIVGGSLEEAADLAHALKGSSGNIGAMQLHRAAEALEQACRGQSSDRALEALAALEERLEQVLGGLEGLPEAD